MRIFLGGTCNNSDWRNKLIPYLGFYEIDYFNPVVKDWTPECQEQELFERQNCDYVLYLISPEMTGVYSIAEVVDDSNKRPDKTIFVLYKLEEFSDFMQKSLRAVSKMVESNGSLVVESSNIASIFFAIHKGLK